MSRARSAAAKFSDAAPVFAALGETTRLTLVARLCAEGPLSISRLSEGTGVTRQAITKHLHTLAQAGVVHGSRSGPRTHLGARNQAPREGAAVPRSDFRSVGCRDHSTPAVRRRKAIRDKGRGRPAVPARPFHSRCVGRPSRQLSNRIRPSRHQRTSGPNPLSSGVICGSSRSFGDGSRLGLYRCQLNSCSDRTERRYA